MTVFTVQKILGICFTDKSAECRGQINIDKGPSTRTFSHPILCPIPCPIGMQIGWEYMLVFFFWCDTLFVLLQPSTPTILHPLRSENASWHKIGHEIGSVSDSTSDLLANCFAGKSDANYIIYTILYPE
jgi:hypothetical protein